MSWQKYDLMDKPYFILNVDEKGISQNHSPPVVAGMDVQPPPTAVTSVKSATTIFGYGSAAGVAVTHSLSSWVHR